MAILTVSRECGSGGREIGRAVAEALNYDYVDKERLLNDIRAEGERWAEWGKDLDEHCPTIWEKYDWSFRGFGALLQKEILEYALRDRVVIMGRGAHFLLWELPFVVCIRVVAPLDVRMERIMVRESVDRETARWLADKIDNDRSCFVRVLYGKNWEHTNLFHAVLDTSEISLEVATERVVTLLKERDSLKTPAAEHHLRMLAAAAGVRAGLATNSSIFLPTIEVAYDGENIVLRGIIHNLKEHDRIEKLARKLAGDLPFKCALTFRG